YSPKTFRCRRPNGRGGWINNAGERRVLYRLPELLQFPDATAFVCEGEKDADRVASLGHCATTVASGDWDDVNIETLAGRDCWILEDNDATGRKKALNAAAILYGTAASIRIVRLPNLGESEDVSDWLDANPRNADKLPGICFEAPEFKPSETPQEPKEGEKNEQLVALPFISVAGWHGAPVPHREWAVLNRVPAKNITLLSGDGGVGKTILAL